MYNNESGIFLGELIHEFVRVRLCTPQIPVVSIDREEGLEIIESIKNERVLHLMNLFYNPDYVASF